jgi:cell division septum initiation protein DivIVA
MPFRLFVLMASLGDPSDISKKQRELRSTTAQRLEAIVEAAEKAAEGVIDDAEVQARRYLAQARAEADRLAADRVDEVSELVDSLLGQALSLRQEAERLQKTLEEAKTRFDGGEDRDEVERPGGYEEIVEPEEVRAPRLRAVAGEEERPPEVGARSDSAGARLLATQMAISGSSREEIAHRLRNGFEIEDADAILDAILGPEDR